MPEPRIGTGRFFLVASCYLQTLGTEAKEIQEVLELLRVLRGRRIDSPAHE